MVKGIGKPESDTVTLSDNATPVLTPGGGTAWTKSLTDTVFLSELFQSVLTPGISPGIVISLNQLSAEEMKRREIRAFLKSGVDALTPSVEFGSGIMDDFASIRNHKYPTVWQKIAPVSSTIGNSAPLDRWTIELYIAKLDKMDSNPEDYEDIVDECDEIAQKLVYKYRNIIDGYKLTRIEELKREPFVRKYSPDCITGVTLSFILISPDQTNVC